MNRGPGTSSLAVRHCAPCHGDTPALGDAEARALLAELRGWLIESGRLIKLYPFRNFHETMAFVNALAWIAHREDHHPVLIVEYNKCRVEYYTHAIDGLSENDFICAAKCDALILD